MRVRCPHCRHQLEILDDSPLANLSCDHCHSSFSLIGNDETLTFNSAAPRQLGHFRLLELLGTGAFGQVWKARDETLDRIVAVKIPRHELLDEDSSDWLLREARAAARLSHPNIVSVHEVGRHEETLYIVADFIDGVTLSDRLTAHSFHPQEAVRLCSIVAAALEHAHNAGIVHRDLKPGNIMIDASGTPFVMDFGLAKRDAAEITMTAEGKVLGTPAYMAPEQARGEAHQADARADVYSLGVVLYELLTGERPFRGNTRMLIHQVLHDEPPPPRKLSAAVPRDLETVCLKCLEKRPERRYQTARELADDLGRWQRREPISARPIGRLERGVRWCQRNPTVARLAAAVILVANLGFAGVLYQWRQSQLNLAEARAQRAEAEWQRLNALRLAENARLQERDATRARQQAEARQRETLDKVDAYFINVSQARELRVPGLQRLRERLLKMALSYYQSYAAGRRRDPSLQSELAGVHRRMADMYSLIGQHEDRIRHARHACIIAEKAVRAQPGNLDFRVELASCYNQLAAFHEEVGDLDAALAMRREAVTITDDALAFLEQLEIVLEGGADSKAELLSRLQQAAAQSHLGSGILHSRRRHMDEATKHYLRAAALREQLVRENRSQNTVGLAWVYNNLGVIYHSTGRMKMAADGYRRAIALVEELLGDYPENTDFQAALALMVKNLGEMHHAQGENTCGDQLLGRARQLYEDLARANPDVDEHKYRLAGCLRAAQLDSWHSAASPSAIEELQRARQLAEPLVQRHPDLLKYRVELAEVLRQLALAEDRPDCLSEACDILQPAETPIDEQLPANQAAWARCRADLLMGRDAPSGPDEWQEVTAVWSTLFSDAEATPHYSWHAESARSYLHWAESLREAGESAEAMAALERARNTLQAAVNRLEPSLIAWAECQLVLGAVHWRMGNHEAAERSLRATADFWPGGHPIGLLLQAHVLRAQNQSAEADAAYRRAEALDPPPRSPYFAKLQREWQVHQAPAER